MGLHLYFAPTNELKTDLFQVQWCVSYLSQLFVFYTFLLIQRVTSSSTVTIRITLIAIWMQTITSQLCLIDNIVRLPNCKQCNIPWTRDFIPNGKCVNHFTSSDSTPLPIGFGHVNTKKSTIHLNAGYKCLEDCVSIFPGVLEWFFENFVQKGVNLSENLIKSAWFLPSLDSKIHLKVLSYFN